jgi:hypothetical protein
VIGRGIASKTVAVVVAGLATVGAGHTGPVVLEVVIETSACVRSNSRVDNSVIGGIARGAGSWIGTGKAAVEAGLAELAAAVVVVEGLAETPVRGGVAIGCGCAGETARKTIAAASLAGVVAPCAGRVAAIVIEVDIAWAGKRGVSAVGAGGAGQALSGAGPAGAATVMAALADATNIIVVLPSRTRTQFASIDSHPSSRFTPGAFGSIGAGIATSLTSLAEGIAILEEVRFAGAGGGGELAVVGLVATRAAGSYTRTGQASRVTFGTELDCR